MFNQIINILISKLRVFIKKKYLLLILGRRKAIMIFDVIFMIGSILTIILDTTSLMLGRFIQGLSIGAFYTIPPVYLSEITPVSLMGSVGAMMGVSPSSALIISFALGTKIIIFAHFSKQNIPH